ncbi:MAG: SHOCT domain-containing protein [Ilumatobacteraceae bacterium]
MMRRGVGRVGRPSLIGTAARTAVIAGTATAVSGKVAAGQQANAQQAAQARAFEAQQQQAAINAAVAEQVAAQQAAPPPPPPPPAAAPAPAAGGLSDEVIAQLKQLGELRDAGILTEDEFSAKKAKLLGL